MRLLATVRGRTAVGATLALGVALVLGASVAGGLLRRSLIHNLDQVAEVRAADVATLAVKGELPRGLASAGDEIVQVVGPGGMVLAASLPAALDRPLAVLRPPPGQFRTRTVARLGGGVGAEGEYRLLALRGTGGADPPVVYVATGLDAVEHTAAVESRLVLLGLPALLALVAASAWLAVGRALRPVEGIRAEVADITARELDRRVPQSGAGDEVDRLARTMNALLDRLESSALRQRRFVADASEELVAPLAATRAALEAGLASPPDPGQDGGGWPLMGTELLRQHRRMERLVRDLLYLARVDAGAPRAPLAPVDLDDIVLSEVTRLRAANPGGHPRAPGPGGHPRAPGPGGPIRFDTATVSAAPMEGRPEDLRRAVRNLLEHAERHAAAVVRIELWTDEEGDVTLVVEDDGTAELPAEADLVFERFTRLPGPSLAGDTGSGLALAIVRDIALAHGGRVGVEAVAPGSRFVLHLPAG